MSQLSVNVTCTQDVRRVVDRVLAVLQQVQLFLVPGMHQADAY